MWLRHYKVYEILRLRNIHWRKGCRSCKYVFRATLTAVFHQQRAYSSKLTRKEKKKLNYYDVLEITPKATQAQVKDAYYTLSKKYHPDQYKGEKGAAKFREIKEAYEILGNFSQRKMYDKGLLGMHTAAMPEEAKEYASKFHEMKKRGPMPTMGRTPIYDFDEWAQAHYTEARTRRVNSKTKFDKMESIRKENEEEKTTQAIISTLLIFTVISGIYYSMSESNDTPKTKGS